MLAAPLAGAALPLRLGLRTLKSKQNNKPLILVLHILYGNQLTAVIRLVFLQTLTTAKIKTTTKTRLKPHIKVDSAR